MKSLAQVNHICVINAIEWRLGYLWCGHRVYFTAHIKRCSHSNCENTKEKWQMFKYGGDMFLNNLVMSGNGLSINWRRFGFERYPL